MSRERSQKEELSFKVSSYGLGQAISFDEPMASNVMHSDALVEHIVMTKMILSSPFQPSLMTPPGLSSPPTQNLLNCFTALPVFGITLMTLNRTCQGNALAILAYLPTEYGLGKQELGRIHRSPQALSQLTVLLSGLHCPTVTVSPSSTRNAGLTCAARFECLFSYRAYLGIKWRYSRRMMRVRCILVETTLPVRIRPRMETMPVKGHFLSVTLES